MKRVPDSLPRSQLRQVKSGPLGMVLEHQWFWKPCKWFQCGAKAETKCLKWDMDAFMFKIILIPTPCFTHGIFHLGRSPLFWDGGDHFCIWGQSGCGREKQHPFRGRAVSYSSPNRDVGTRWYCSHRGEQLFPDSWLRAAWLHPLCFSCSQAP